MAEGAPASSRWADEDEEEDDVGPPPGFAAAPVLPASGSSSEWEVDDDLGPPPGFVAASGSTGAGSSRGTSSNGATSSAPPAAAAATAGVSQPSTEESKDNSSSAVDEAALASAQKNYEELTRQLGSMGQIGDTTSPAQSDQAQNPDRGLDEHPDAEVTVQTAENSIYSSAKTFEELNLHPDLLKALYVEMRFTKPSSIQALTLPMIVVPPYKDLIAQAQNGSGKTTCFVLAMLSRVDPEIRETQALCVCNTRELVVQNLSIVERMAKLTGITSSSTAADLPRGHSLTEQVVVGTHGRLKLWSSKRQLNLDTVVILVFDEADEMLKADGFADDSVRLIKRIRQKNPTMQLLLFSATFNDVVKRFAHQIAPNANTVFVKKEELSLDVIAQYNVRCPDRAAKTRVLKEMIFPNCERLGQTMIFVKTKESAKTLHAEMEREGYKCTSIQGDMQNQDRDKVVQEFRDGVTKILISTDVLARGFDVSQVTLVINYDAPTMRDNVTPDMETYMHRIGRSGRFGRKGAAFNLICTDQEQQIINRISDYFKKEITPIDWADEDMFVAVLEKTL